MTRTIHDLMPLINGEPRNLNFTEGDVKKRPVGWHNPPSSREAGYRTQVLEGYVNGHPSKRFVEVLRAGRRLRTVGCGNCMQSFKADSLRGKYMAVRAWVRVLTDEPSMFVEPPAEQTQARLWVRVDGPGRPVRVVAYDCMEDRPIASTEWTEHVLVVEVPTDALFISIGVLADGDRKVHATDFELSAFGKAALLNKPAQELTEIQVANFTAFARVLGYVRYFHPSDEAASTNWDEFVMQAIDQIEDCITPHSLVRTLKGLFYPIAPTVRLVLSDDGISRDRTAVSSAMYPRELYATGFADFVPTELVRWRHSGLGGRERGLFSSMRVMNTTLKSKYSGYLIQEFSASRYINRKFAFRAVISATVDASGGNHAGLAVFCSAGRTAHSVVLASMEAEPITSKRWEQYEVQGLVPEDAVSLVLAVKLVGRGSVEIVNASFDVVDVEEMRSVLVNSSLMDGALGHAPPGWTVQSSDVDAQYTAQVVLFEAKSGLKATLLESHVVPGDPPFPLPSEPYVHTSIGRGIAAIVPTTVFVDGKQFTIPFGDPSYEPSVDAMDMEAAFWGAGSDDDVAEKEPAHLLLPSPTNRTCRLAAVIQLWNVVQHFFPHMPEAEKLARESRQPFMWSDLLGHLLQTAATCSNEADVLDALQMAVARLRDGQASVTHVSQELRRFMLPFTWEHIDGSLVITRCSADCAAQDILPGDVVVRIDGRATEAMLMDVEKRVSASSARHRRVRALNLLASGESGEALTLLLRRSTTGETLTKRVLKETPIKDGVTVTTPPVRQVTLGCLYVDLSRMTRADWESNIAQLTLAQGFVFDLRQPPAIEAQVVLGHFSKVPVRSPLLCMPTPTLPDRKTPIDAAFTTSQWTILPHRTQLSTNCVWLSGPTSAGVAETWLQIIRHHRLGAIVGPTSSAGTNGVVNSVRLIGGFKLSWTGQKVLNQDGSPFHGVGVGPDYVVVSSIEDVISGDDPALKMGIVLLEERLAKDGTPVPKKKRSMRVLPR